MTEFANAGIISNTITRLSVGYSLTQSLCQFLRRHMPVSTLSGPLCQGTCLCLSLAVLSIVLHALSQ